MTSLQLEQSVGFYSAGVSHDPSSFPSIVTHSNVSWPLLMGGFTSPLEQNFVLLLGELQEVLLDKLPGVTGFLGMETLLFIYLYIIYVFL